MLKYVEPDKGGTAMEKAFLEVSQKSIARTLKKRRKEAIKQFLSDVSWGDLDNHIIDSLPGLLPENALFFLQKEDEDNAWAKSCDGPFLGSIPLDLSLTQSLEDSQALIDLFPDLPKLNAVKMITSKLVQMESN